MFYHYYQCSWSWGEVWIVRECWRGLVVPVPDEDSCDKRDTGIIDSGIIDGEDKMENKEQGKLI